MECKEPFFAIIESTERRGIFPNYYKPWRVESRHHHEVVASVEASRLPRQASQLVCGRSAPLLCLG